MTNVQMFFVTRSTARTASFGKMTDNGQGSSNRWARTVEVSSTKKKEPMTLNRTGRRGGSVSTTVIMKKSKILA